MKKGGYLFLITIFAVACKKPYAPPAIAAAGSYLVVEGIINSGPDSTFITLSRTVNLGSAVTTNPVTGAVLTIESDQNAVYPLSEAGNGKYQATGLNLDNARQYRLRIKTANDQYLSDYAPVLNSPPIDSVYLKISATGLTVYSATDDPFNMVNFYRWNYGETWIIHPAYDSDFISNGDTVLARTLSQQIYTCWTSDSSSNIVLGSSAKLAKSVIIDNPIIALPSTSPKIANEYSILVRQYALTADAYNFWTNLKKNTEQLGSIFDAQPSQINGNIHSTVNLSEPVIGYISVGNTSAVRIFIRPRQLPAWPANQNVPSDCGDLAIACLYAFYPQGSNVPVNQVNEFINYNKGANYPLIPVSAIQVQEGPILGYIAAPASCVDCTLYGSKIQPVYWQY